MAAPIAPPEAVAFLGLGRMGVPMAARLVGAGFTLRGWDLAPPARLAAAAAGIPLAASAAEACRDAAAVITMLPDGKAVRAALEDPAVAGTLTPDTLVIDMSSSDPLGTRALHTALAGRGVALIDAPVSGGVARAIDGTLAIMAGGEAAAIDRAATLFAAMGKHVFRCGPPGAGHAMKALNNYVSAAGLVAAVEAVAVGQRFGLDPSTMVDVLNASTGRNNSTEVKLKQHILSGGFGSGFSIGLMAKDLATAGALAEGLGIDAPLAVEMARRWRAAAEALGPGADHTAIARLILPRD
ncbi:NAD(P)-dependent oxidoreductase [Elioraea sp. Yellowstone]|uniref:NAD(P)-dependent oxidoreductase n=1 Tax=Elioraea sp. Yellowstone TaxID=2592070 RepID=UPI001152E9F8|nr:NAD(P)-dependent oxidoreductase [Elioraea sp. Yellowstone]TQF80131.1 NAD(P)-dependent oxidoreductase [Elioraea sp. Yellowstone]